MERLQRIAKSRCAVCVESTDPTHTRRFVSSMLWAAKVVSSCPVSTRESSRSGVFVSTRGDVLVAVGVTSVDVNDEGTEATVRCRSFLELHIDHPSPAAVLVAARMLGGMAAMVD
jgi:hypothetical protein